MDPKIGGLKTEIADAPWQKISCEGYIPSKIDFLKIRKTSKIDQKTYFFS